MNTLFLSAYSQEAEPGLQNDPNTFLPFFY